MPAVQTSRGTINYTDTGSGPVVLLVHGLLVDGSLWDEVRPLLAAGHRVVVPDMPLGSHRDAMRPGADLSPTGLAALVAELMDRLDLTGVTLVGNDTGGAICQLVAAYHPQRLAGLVLTNCDAYTNFLPLAFRPLQLLPRIPGALGLTARVLPTRPVRAALGMLATGGLPEDAYRRWIEPSRNAAIRADVGAVLTGISSRDTMRAIAVLRGSDLPTLIAWGTADPFFRRSYARRLAADIPDARLEWIEGARTFVPLDAPQQLADLIADHIRRSG